MNKSVIHIGFPRAASTFLQYKFFPNVTKMDFLGKPHNDDIKLAMSNLCYLENEAYIESNTPEVFRKFIKQKPVILSNEGIAIADNGTVITQDPAVIANRLREIFDDAKIIIIIRNQLSWIESYYLRKSRIYNFGQTIKTPTEWFMRHYKSPGHSVLGRADYFRLYKAFKKNFTEVEVIPLEELRDDYDLFLKKLCNIVGEDVLINNNKPINEGTTKLRIFLGYVHRFLLPKFFLVPFRPLLKKFKKSIVKFLESGPKAKVVFSDKIKEMIYDLYSESNFKLNNSKKLSLEKYNYFLKDNQ